MRPRKSVPGASSIALVVVLLFVCLLTGSACSRPSAFPYGLPDEKPDRPMSAAMARPYSQYAAVTPENNELFSNFKYTRLKGFDYHDHDGRVSRRDPSRVIRANGKYYVWYARRHTSAPPRGAGKGTETIPSTDWDLSEIWYATSDDGFTWQERGIAVPRPPKPQAGWRSVSTPDMLVWKGRYYLYYQGFLEMSGLWGDARKTKGIEP